jgi:hypothetical protein
MTTNVTAIYQFKNGPSASVQLEEESSSFLRDVVTFLPEHIHWHWKEPQSLWSTILNLIFHLRNDLRYLYHTDLTNVNIYFIINHQYANYIFTELRWGLLAHGDAFGWGTALLLAHGDAVGWGTALQDRKLGVEIPIFFLLDTSCLNRAQCQLTL